MLFRSAGATLIITNTATDSDIPANSFTFSLATNAPAGSAIDPITGVLTWAPADAQAKTTNNLTVRVTDNGSPAMSDARSFTVTVVSRPVIQSIILSNQIVTITWSAISNQTYRLQYQQNLGATNWTDLLPTVTASGPTASRTDSIAPAPQRFYRVHLIP